MAILDEKTLDFFSSSVEQTVRLGVRLGELLKVGDLVCMSGELGTGKTAMAQGIGRGWGAGRHVTSPSFTLISEYPRLRDGRVLYHIDCYRLENQADIITAGLDEIWENGGAVMVEWAENIADILPDGRLWVDFRYINDTRRGLRISSTGDRSLDLLAGFRKSAFGV
jgi:tRNA threonylcarbamoyladenosine biosynthesis protein TsaE